MEILSKKLTNLDLPNFTWGPYLVSAGSHEFSSVDLSTKILGRALFSLYPRLSFGDLCSIFYKFKDKHPDQVSSFWKIYNYHYNEHLDEIASALLRAPHKFQEYVASKKWKPRDLQPLKRLGKNDNSSHFLSLFSELSLSYSQSIQCLEWCVDFMNLGRSDIILDLLTKNKDTSAQVYSKLYKMAHPATSTEDSKRDLLAKQISLPPYVRSSWIRSGDKTYLKLECNLAQKSHIQKLQNHLINQSNMIEGLFHEEP